MKNIQLCILLMAIALFNTNYVYGQFNPGENNQVLANAGFGFSGYGIPIYASVDFGVASNITVGGILSFQTNTERIRLFTDNVSWKHTIFGIGVRGDYHFNELLDLSDEWDFYGGLGLDYYSWETKLKEGSTATYSGSGSGGFGISARVGGRYFFNDKLGINLEFGGGSVLSSGRVGVSLKL